MLMAVLYSRGQCRINANRRMWQLFRPAINTAHFYFFVAEVMSNYLTTDGLKIFFSTSGGSSEARGPWHLP